MIFILIFLISATVFYSIISVISYILCKTGHSEIVEKFIAEEVDRDGNPIHEDF